MAEVALSVAGRSYPVACRDGEEAHLLSLAARVNEKAGEAKSAVGDTNEPRLLLLAALLLADELHEAGSTVASPPQAPSGIDPKLSKIADALERLALRLEA